MIETSNFKVLGYSIPGFLLVAASAWLSRLLTTAISLISIKILLDTLGTEHYAVYAVLMGTVSWFMLADMGTGQSLQNYISEARATNQGYAEYILATATIALVVAIFVVVLVVALGEWPAKLLLNQFKFLTDTDKYISFSVVAVLVVLTAGGSIIYRIWYAEQKGYMANISAALAAVVAFAGIYYVAISDLENKLLWCLTAANAPFAAFPVAGILIRVLKIIRVSAKSITDPAKNILYRGSKFWFFNIAAAAVLQVDYIVLALFATADQIVIYSIAVKVFAAMAFMIGAVLQAFWPVCAEAVVKGDWQRIKLFIKRYLIFSISSVTIFTILFVMFSLQIASILSPHELIIIPTPLIIFLGVMYVIRVWTDVFAVVLQSMNDIKMLLIWVVMQAAIGLGFQILLVPRYGMYGTITALCISWLLTVSWLLPNRVWGHQYNMIEGKA